MNHPMTEYPADIAAKARERAEYAMSQMDACSCEDCIATATGVIAQALMEEREKAARIVEDTFKRYPRIMAELHQGAVAIRTGGE